MKQAIIIPCTTILLALPLSICLAAGPTVKADAMAAAPAIDGKVDDWGGVAATKVKVVPAIANDDKNYSGSIDVSIRSGIFENNIYFLLEWQDDTKDETHKTLFWNKEKDAYDTGKDREDRAILKFDMGGDFTSCMLSGKEYKADIWHWKAFRSNSAGYAHDKMHIFSAEQIPKAKKHSTHDGKEIWIARPSDKGNKPYKSNRPIDNIGDSVPSYIVSENWIGSVGDVKTAATHDGGKWTLEIVRKQDTGNDDDVKFEQGKTYNSGIAVFNHTGDYHHSTGSFALKIAK